MKILGIGGSVHDYSYCIVEDGNILIAIEEERISREKNALGKRSLGFSGINYCLKNLNLSFQDIDLVVSNTLMSDHEFEKICNKKVIYLNHHLTHAASVYFTSGFCDSAILVMDGKGDPITPSKVETVTLAYGMINHINVIEKHISDNRAFVSKSSHKWIYEDVNSLAHLYHSVTLLCGFSLFNEGKLMGLAAYGKDTYYKEFKKYINIVDNKVSSDRRAIMDLVADILYECPDDKLFEKRADLAYAMQKILEECVITMLNHLYKTTRCKNLCFAGGIALNSSLNGKILSNVPFENIHIFPAACDSGTSVGAALYGYYNIGGHFFTGQKKMTSAYFGKIYDDTDVEAIVKKYSDKLEFKYVSKSDIVKSAASDLKNGKIVGWFQGGSEFGPRSLGHRSILANPAIKDMKDIINSRVKFRESFRPFAPSVLKEYTSDYFECIQEESKYMLFVYKVRDEKMHLIPSVTHVDQTARIQTVDRDSNDIFYDLIVEFNNQAGIPLVLNTSFNIKGQPIVETPDDAIKAFLGSDIDTLYINNYVIIKKNKRANEKDCQSNDLPTS